jgi:hypothetical protein
LKKVDNIKLNKLNSTGKNYIKDGEYLDLLSRDLLIKDGPQDVKKFVEEFKSDVLDGDLSRILEYKNSINSMKSAYSRNPNKYADLKPLLDTISNETKTNTSYTGFERFINELSKFPNKLGGVASTDFA